MGGVAFEALKHYAKNSSWLHSDRNAEELLAEMEKPEMFGEDHAGAHVDGPLSSHFPHEEAEERVMARVLCTVGR